MVAAYVSGATAAAGDNYTPPSGTDTALGWMACGYGSGGRTASGQIYNSISMTELQDLLNDLAGGGDPFGQFAEIVNPGTSSQVIDLTWNSGPTGETGFAFTMSGVDQTTPVYPTNGNVPATYTTDTNPALTYDNPANSVIVYWKLHRQTGTPSFTLPTGFTERFSNELITSPANITVKLWTMDQSGSQTGATVSSSMGASTGGVHGVIVFQPAAAAGGRIMSSLANAGGLAHLGGLAGRGGGLAG